LPVPLAKEAHAKASEAFGPRHQAQASFIAPASASKTCRKSASQPFEKIPAGRPGLAPDWGLVPLRLQLHSSLPPTAAQFLAMASPTFAADIVCRKERKSRCFQS